MKYYVNEGNKFGKTFEAKDDVYAVGYAEGFAYGKGWKSFNVYCKDTGENVVRLMTTREPKDWAVISQDFIDWHKMLFNKGV